MTTPGAYRVLALTSPHMTDAAGETAIADAQRLLAHNHFGDFVPLGDASQSGEFGEATAGACHRAKFWLGWPAGESSCTYGRNLNAYLAGQAALPTTYKLRRNRRLHRARTAHKARALALAVEQVGKKESPANSNRIAFSTWYGVIGPWCAMFQTWVGVQSGETGFDRGIRWAYVPYLDYAAASTTWGMSFIPAAGVEPGDLVTYDWDGDGVSDHVGRFERWITRGRTFYAIEGNTAVGNDSNGGEVMRRKRDLSLVHHFIHLDD